MRSVFVISAYRTPIGRFGGSLQSLSAAQLAGVVINHAVSESTIDCQQIDEVIIGNVFQAGGKANPARQASILGGLPVEIPAMTINKQCASGLRAITLAYQQIMAEEADIIVAGGTESMTNVPHLVLNGRWGEKIGDLKTVDGLLYDGLHCSLEGYHMGVTAENLVELYSLTREEQDIFSYNSHRKALKAIKEGKFKREIVPVDVRSKLFENDENPRETDLDKLMNLKPVFKPNGSVTAGNSSSLNDGAAIVILASENKVKELGLKPLAQICSAASAGVSPSIMGIGPVPASQKALKKAGLNIHDIDLFELNEAFAAQAISVMRELDVNEEIVNVNGGAIALGHPVGCSGARILVSLIHGLIQEQKKLGLASLCIGGGQGASIIVERI